MVNLIIITGRSGIGKTTVLKEVLKEMRRRNIPSLGFYAEELRELGSRIGFDVVTLDGRREKLARILAGAERCQHRVKNYAVNIPSFNNLVVPIFEEYKQNKRQVLIVDEIGRMQLFSSEFRQNVHEFLRSEGVMVAVVAQAYLVSFVSGQRMEALTRVFTVNSENQSTIVQPIIEEVQKVVDSALFKDEYDSVADESPNF